jgi:phosphoenolpyruvate synthase/pyruvate phosphate dikinase
MQSYLKDCISKGIGTSISDASVKIDDYLYNLVINDVIDNTLNASGIRLNEDWKAKAASYVFHIREVVSRAEMIEGLRERIFDRLNQLQSEIDRNRTYAESISAVFLTITEAMSRGAKHLEPAVKLVERLAGALSGFSTASVEHETQFKLPGPEQFGLDDLPADNASQ